MSSRRLGDSRLIFTAACPPNQNPWCRLAPVSAPLKAGPWGGRPSGALTGQEGPDLRVRGGVGAQPLLANARPWSLVKLFPLSIVSVGFISRVRVLVPSSLRNWWPAHRLVPSGHRGIRLDSFCHRDSSHQQTVGPIRTPEYRTGVTDSSRMRWEQQKATHHGEMD